LADYDATFVPGADQVKSRLKDANKFVEKIEQLLRDTGFKLTADG
jgi:uncharacterized protein (UPF0332 family)